MIRNDLPRGPQLRVTTYDRVSMLLVAALLVFGSIVLMLFALWMTTSLQWGSVGYKVTLIPSGGADHPQGAAEQPDPPASDELLEEPQPALRTSLEAVTTALSRQAALVTGAIGAGAAGLPSLGDARVAGPPGPPSDVVPRWDRWEVRFSSGSLDLYRRQLDHFDVELAAFGGAPTIDYAYNLTKARPDTRQSTDAKSEKRVRFTWKPGPLLDYDRQLLRGAGIPVRGRVICQFYSPDMEAELLRLESQCGRPSQQWLKTIFGVRPAAGGYEFYILEQRFRPAT